MELRDRVRSRRGSEEHAVMKAHPQADICIGR